MGSRPALASDLHRIERITSELSGKYGRRSTPQLADCRQLAVQYYKKVFTETPKKHMKHHNTIHVASRTNRPRESGFEILKWGQGSPSCIGGSTR
jgi:hypothetical protein